MRTLLATLTVALVGLTPPSVLAQGAADRWLPWYGCWQSVGTVSVPGLLEPIVRDGASLCVVPSDAGVHVMSVVNGTVSTDDTIVADGVDRPIGTTSCTGVRRAEWSQDGHMLFMASVAACTGRSQTVSRLLTLTNGPIWIDLQVVRQSGTGDLVQARRYARVSVPASVEDHLPPELVARATLAAQSTGRVPLAVAHVIEASGRTTPVGVEALILETTARFSLNTRDLIALQKGRVAERVIDLMVAVSYPQHFSVNQRALPAPPMVLAGASGGFANPFSFSVWDPLFYNSYNYGDYDDHGALMCSSGLTVCRDYYPGSRLRYYQWGTLTGGADEAVTAGSSGTGGGAPTRGIVRKDRGYSSGRDASASEKSPTSPPSSSSRSSSRSSPSSTSESSSSSSDSSSSSTSGGASSGGTASGGYAPGSSSSDTGRTAVPR